MLLRSITLISSSMAVCHFLSRTASSKLIFSAFAKRHTRCTSFLESYKSCKLHILGCRGSSSSSVVSEFILVDAMTDDSLTSIITSAELFQSHSFSYSHITTHNHLLAYRVKHLVSFCLLIIPNKNIPFS